MQRISFPQVPEKLMSSMMETENYVNSLGFDFKMIELMRFRVSQINGCAYCLDMHFKEAIAAGEKEQRLYSLSAWRETNYYSKKEQALLAWAESVTLLGEKNVELQSLFEDLSNHFSVEEIANLTLAVSQINSWNRLAVSFGFEAGNYQVGKH